MSKRREGGERSEGLSDGGVEFDRRESVTAKGGKKEGISIFQRISLSQFVTRCLHSYQLDTDSCTNWLKEVFLNRTFDQVCARALHCAASADKKKENVCLRKCCLPNACAHTSREKSLFCASGRGGTRGMCIDKTHRVRAWI